MADIIKMLEEEEIARLGKKIRRGGGGFDDRAAAEVALARA